MSSALPRFAANGAALAARSASAGSPSAPSLSSRMRHGAGDMRADASRASGSASRAHAIPRTPACSKT